MKSWTLGLLFLLTTGNALAAVEVQSFAGVEQQRLYQQLITELRCLVCQNQNLADSNAALALDLRRQTAEMIRAGKGESEIVDFMVSRYGDFVLYRPPLKSSTWLLWGGPLLILIFALTIALRFARGRTRDFGGNVEARARAKQLLSEDSRQ